MSAGDRSLILIVEDDTDIGSMLVEVLEDEGYVVLHATRADAALEHLETIVPALMILDMNLPGMTGAELLPLVRQRPGGESLPVIIASAQHKIPKETKQLAQAVLAKPFALGDLLAIIHRLVPPAATDKVDQPDSD